MLHVLPATAKSVHWGYFDASLAPALRVKSGDLVQVEAVSHHAGDAPDLLMDRAIRQLFNDIPRVGPESGCSRHDRTNLHRGGPGRGHA